MINFPFVHKRRCVVDGVKGFFCPQFLAQKEIAQWIVEAETCEFAPKKVGDVDPHYVLEFVGGAFSSEK
jgi:hypothetical protein